MTLLISAFNKTSHLLEESMGSSAFSPFSILSPDNITRFYSHGMRATVFSPMAYGIMVLFYGSSHLHSARKSYSNINCTIGLEWGVVFYLYNDLLSNETTS